LECLRKPLEKWQLHPPQTHQKLHEFRIFDKKSRYLLELIDCPTDALKKAQDEIGRAHDLTLLEAVAGRNKQLVQDASQAWKRSMGAVAPAIASLEKSLSGSIKKRRRIL
jgi:hypothetical protein